MLAILAAEATDLPSQRAAKNKSFLSDVIFVKRAIPFSPTFLRLELRICAPRIHLIMHGLERLLALRHSQVRGPEGEGDWPQLTDHEPSQDCLLYTSPSPRDS